jgi:hypothetical protein
MVKSSAYLFETLMECGEERLPCASMAAEQPDDRHRRLLLRADREQLVRQRAGC